MADAKKSRKSEQAKDNRPNITKLIYAFYNKKLPQKSSEYFCAKKATDLKYLQQLIPCNGIHQKQSTPTTNEWTKESNN